MEYNRFCCSHCRVSQHVNNPPLENVNKILLFLSLVEIFFSSKEFGLKVVRTFRVLRPLRAINRVPSLKILVQQIINTMPILSELIMIGVMLFAIFGVAGVQLWKGVLRNRCFSNDNTTLLDSNATNYYKRAGADFICTLGDGLTTCEDIPDSEQNSQFTLCKVSEMNPFRGAISFDNIGYAFITIFQVVYQIYSCKLNSMNKSILFN